MSGSAEQRARLGRWLLALVICASALGLGAVHTQVLAACAAGAALATGLLWYEAPPIEPRPAATMLVIVATLLIAWTAFQLVPLPSGLLAKLAPNNADVWARCLAPLHEPGPAYASISLDPVATRVQILRGITYLVVFLGALRVAQRQEGIAFLERSIVVSVTLLAAAGVMHPALGARKIFGLYEPGETYAYDPHHLAPLLNTNHLAAYINIGLIIAVASVLERREAIPRPVAAVIVLMLGVATLWTLSRGGAATMVLGVVLVALMAFASRRLRRVSVAGPAAVSLVVACAVFVLILTAGEETRSKFSHNDYQKIDLVKNALSMAIGHPIFGVGRGAFESTFPAVRIGKEYWVNTHPEDIVAQWTTEWGIPVAIAALVAIGWALRPKTALARSRAPAGAWAALFAVAAHNLVDFSSEVPGVMIALVACAAMVTGGSDAARERRSGWARSPKTLAIGAVALVTLGIGITVPFIGDELYNEQRSFRDLGLDRGIDKNVFRAEARAAMLRHPAEPYFPFVGAVRATVVRDDSVLPWAARVLERSPVHGRVHLLLARSLFSRSPSQARLEYRLACEHDGQLCYHFEEAAPLVGSFDDAMQLVPDGPRGALVLTQLVELLGRRLPSTVVRLDRELEARDPQALDPIRRVAAASLADVQNDETWCVPKTECIKDGLAAAHRLQTASPQSCEGHALAAELSVAAGETDAGFAELDTALDTVKDRSVCARRLVSLAQQTKNVVRIDAAIDRLLKVGCEEAQECVDNLLFAANVESSRGGAHRAVVLTKKAWERMPENDALLVQVAQRAEAQGFHGEALEAYTKLAEREPGEPKWALAVIRERDAVSRGVFERRQP